MLENPENRAGGIETLESVIAAEEKGRKMAAIGIAQAAGGNVVFGKKKGGERAVGSVLAEKLIDGLQEELELIQGDGGLAAKVGLEIGHEKGRRDAFAGNVADDQAETAGAEVEEVVVVAADLAGLKADAGVVESWDGRKSLGKKASLDLFGNFQLLGGAALGFEFFGNGATLRFHGVGHFVKTDKRESVAINVAEARKDAAPNGGLFTKKRRRGRRIGRARLGIILDALEAGGELKMNAAFGPFLKFSDNVFGDEDDLRGAANELVLRGVGLGSNEGENGGAVGRGDGDEAVAGLKLGVVSEVEIELIEVEAKTAIEIANEDVDAVDAEVGASVEGGRGGGHGRDYKAEGSGGGVFAGPRKRRRHAQGCADSARGYML